MISFHQHQGSVQIERSEGWLGRRCRRNSMRRKGSCWPRYRRAAWAPTTSRGTAASLTMLLLLQVLLLLLLLLLGSCCCVDSCFAFPASPPDNADSSKAGRPRFLGFARAPANTASRSFGNFKLAFYFVVFYRLGSVAI